MLGTAPAVGATAGGKGGHRHRGRPRPGRRLCRVRWRRPMTPGDLVGPAGISWTHARGGFLDRVGGLRTTHEAFRRTGSRRGRCTTERAAPLSRAASKSPHADDAHDAGAETFLKPPHHRGIRAQAHTKPPATWATQRVSSQDAHGGVLLREHALTPGAPVRSVPLGWPSSSHCSSLAAHKSSTIGQRPIADWAAPGTHVTEARQLADEGISAIRGVRGVGP